MAHTIHTIQYRISDAVVTSVALDEFKSGTPAVVIGIPVKIGQEPVQKIRILGTYRTYLLRPNVEFEAL